MEREHSAPHSLLRAIFRFDHSQISYVIPLRGAIGVVVPLLIGAATSQLLAGLAVSLGALQVAFSDRGGPFRGRAGGMLLAGLGSGLSVFVGSTSGGITWLAVAMAALWAFGGGLVVALGQTATQIGLSSLVLLLVFGARPSDPTMALGQAGLVVLGGLFQTALAVASWPVRPFGAERAALAATFRDLAAFTRAPSDPLGAPPVTGAITNARLTLSGLRDVTSDVGEALRALLDRAERIRLEILALDDARYLVQHEGDDAVLTARIGGALAATGDVLTALADALVAGNPPAETNAPLARIEATLRALRTTDQMGSDERQRTVTARMAILLGQLRAAIEYATQDTSRGRELLASIEATRPFALRLREPAVILRANLNPRSAAFRHAARLAGAVVVADALARGLALPRGYWVPMTLAIVLKPDFGATFSRGLARIVGTLLGLGLATVVVHVALGDEYGLIVLLGVLFFTMRSIGPANYGLLAVFVTGMVVTLTALAGAPPATTIADRGIDTVIGGVLALAAYALWPTWERTQAPPLLADLLDAYRAYVAAVMAGYLEERTAATWRHISARLDATRLAARLARTNAEASVARLREEPARSEEDLDRSVGVLVNSHRFARAAIALEADLYRKSRPPTPPALRPFAVDVERALIVLSATLRDPSSPRSPFPDLRTDQRALANESHDPQSPPNDIPSELAVEADRMTDSLNTIASILGYAH